MTVSDDLSFTDVQMIGIGDGSIDFDLPLISFIKDKTEFPVGWYACPIEGAVIYIVIDANEDKMALVSDSDDIPEKPTIPYHVDDFAHIEIRNRECRCDMCSGIVSLGDDYCRHCGRKLK